MLNLLPILALVLVALIIQQNQNSWRKSLLDALLIWAVTLTILTEGLSAFHVFSFAGLTPSWLIVDLLLAAIYIKHRQLKRREHSQSNPLTSLWQRIRGSLKLPIIFQIQIICIVLILIGVGVVAIVAAPNHSDSMEYHLSRIAHWIQHHSVAHYPTHNLFQLYQNPWSEFAMTHFQILSHSDRLAGSIQWVSMLACILGVSLIAKELGAHLQGQIISAAFCITIPMGLLQGSSTNNDYVVALWLVCFAYFSLLTLRQGAHAYNSARLGSSLGLAILTKGTAYIYSFPFCLWLVLWGIKRYRLKIWRPILPIAMMAILLNLGHYSRNFLLFGSPLGSPGGETNKLFGLRILISNISKQLALHADFIRHLRLQNFITPTTGISEKIIRIFHALIRVDINNPALMSPKHPSFFVPGLSLNEDSAGNPLHLILILISLAFIVINFRLKRRPLLLGYALAVTAGFLLFCLLLTWSPSRCRLHLPIFVLYSGLVGYVISSSLNRSMVNFLAVLLFVLSYPWVLHNSVRPMLGENSIFSIPRIEQYFRTQPALMDLYIESAEVIKSSSCQQLGLDFEGTSFEYPFWILVNHHKNSRIIRHIEVENESSSQFKSPLFREFNPCMIVYFSSQSSQTLPERNGTITPYGLYHQQWSKSKIVGKAKKSVQIFRAISEKT